MVKNILRNRQPDVDMEALRCFCDSRWPEEMGRTHGVEHWDRVTKFGQLLYQEGADLDVILAFAYLHDSERMNNGHDINHGKRASRLIDKIRHTKLKNMTDEQITMLKKACELHTIAHRTGNLTIDICFDADRMDLLRVGIVPLPERMATTRGAELVANPHYEDFYRTFVRETKQ